MTTIPVNTDPPSMVTIAANSFSALVVSEPRAAIVADERAWQLHGSALLRSLHIRGLDATSIVVPAGEACKSLVEFGRVHSRLAQLNFTRDTAIISLGGGAVSDLAGFAAATFLRGIAFYTVPTTLLAMIDAAVGGKTAINIPEGKNLVGAFHQPRQAHVNLGVLSTLPPAVFRQGAAELFKHGLLADDALSRAVLRPGFGPADPDLESIVAAGVTVKVRVIERDPRETGERAFLNFGHTLAHALEALTDHAVPHGDAVGYGMHFAALVGWRLGLGDVSPKTLAFLDYQRPAPFVLPEFDALRPYFARDKKTDSSGWRFVLLDGARQPILRRVTPAEVEPVWQKFCDDLRELWNEHSRLAPSAT